MDCDEEERDGPFGGLFCFGGDRHTDKNEQRRKWLAQVRVRAAPVEQAASEGGATAHAEQRAGFETFAPLKDWGVEFEPANFRPKEDDHEIEAFVLVQVIKFAKPRLEMKVVNVLLELISRLFSECEEQMMERGEIGAARVANALSGFVLSHRFERANPEKLSPRMKVYRTVAVNQLYSAIEAWVDSSVSNPELDALLNSNELIGTPSPGEEEEPSNADKAAIMLQRLEEDPTLLQSFSSDLASSINKLIDDKAAEAHAHFVEAFVEAATHTASAEDAEVAGDDGSREFAAFAAQLASSKLDIILAILKGQISLRIHEPIAAVVHELVAKIKHSKLPEEEATRLMIDSHGDPLAVKKAHTLHVLDGLYFELNDKVCEFVAKSMDFLRKCLE